jgi:hypothetical protein
LQEELTSAAQQAQGIERTMREITTINQMISTAVMQQAEMIETLYNNAVDATQVRGPRALVLLLLCSWVSCTRLQSGQKPCTASTTMGSVLTCRLRVQWRADGCEVTLPLTKALKRCLSLLPCCCYCVAACACAAHKARQRGPQEDHQAQPQQPLLPAGADGHAELAAALL